MTSSPPCDKPLEPVLGGDSAARPRRRGGAVWLLCFTVACITAAELLLKTGALETSTLAGENPLQGFRALASWQTIAGILLQICGFAAWLGALKSVPLALAFNFTMIQQATVALGSWWILRESIPPTRVAGIAVLMLGVFLLIPAIVAAEEKTDAGGEP